MSRIETLRPWWLAGVVWMVGCETQINSSADKETAEPTDTAEADADTDTDADTDDWQGAVPTKQQYFQWDLAT